MDRRFPIQRRGKEVDTEPKSIPWSTAEKAYEVYRQKYGDSQSLERIAQRGGFASTEMDAFYPEWRTELTEETMMSKRRLMELAGVPAEQINEMCGYGLEQQEQEPMVFATVRDAGDGNFIGLVGPFRSEQHAQKFFAQLPDADGLRIEVEAPTAPEQFAEEMGQ